MNTGMHRILVYDYVPDILERRDPHRPAHLAHAEGAIADGGLIAVGATGDPVSGAVFVFGDVGDAAIAAYAEADPYVVNGLVTGWRIEPWNVVAVAS